MLLVTNGGRRPSLGLVCPGPGCLGQAVQPALQSRGHLAYETFDVCSCKCNKNIDAYLRTVKHLLFTGGQNKELIGGRVNEA